MASVLTSELRNRLERVVVEARDIAEAGAAAALAALAVNHHEPFRHMTSTDRALRNALRARARQLGDQQDTSGRLNIGHLITECAYEHWHRMLFARFLAENGLLMEPRDKVAISLAEAQELSKEAGTEVWDFVGRCAQQMLPQIFRPDDPLLRVSLAREYRIKLEGLLDALPEAVFTASDAMGWVYQFWQSRKKDRVNASEVKIGADEISAVTQLFTEPYMVEFLLHNTLGAWWAGKVASGKTKVQADCSRGSSFTTEAEARQACALPGVSWDYLRFIKAEVEVEAASCRLSSTLADKRQDAASTFIGLFRSNDPVEKTVANLPHWRQTGVTYFVTFRTADSLPQQRLQQWLTEKQQWLAAHPEPRDDQAKQEYYERFPERIEHWLDQGYGACHLKSPTIRQIVENALRYFDGQRYTLDTFAIAGNHVHVLVTPKDSHEIFDILHSWKSFTANAINKHLCQSGAFWQKESFDHIVRSGHQLERIRRYIREHEDKRQDAASTLADKRQDATATLVDQRQDAASTYALRPAAGTFADWPAAAAELKILDPCCGSGHFLVAALHHLVPIRMAEEGLSKAAAVDAVLRDNLFGLEIDERCCQLAAFALALEAWKISGWKPLPPLNIACTGIGPQCSAEQWLKLAEDSGIPMPAIGGEFIKQGLLNLHELFSQAATLGSLINPANLPGHLIAADFETIQPYLKAILEAEKTDDGLRERAIAAAGMVKAAELLAGDYTLVITNVPYLGRGKQDEILKKHLEVHYKEGKADLATAFALRCLDFCQSGSGQSGSGQSGSGILPLKVKADRTGRKEPTREGDSAGGRNGEAIYHGSVALVTPQNWLFLTTYTKLRERLLKERQWNFVARLGEHAFDNKSAAGGFAAMVVLSVRVAPDGWMMAGIDVSAPRGQRPIYSEEKAALLRGETVEAASSRLGTLGAASGHAGATAGKESLSAVDLETGATGVDNDGAVIDCEKRLEAASTVTVVSQAGQLENPDARIAFGQAAGPKLLSEYAISMRGVVCGDTEYWKRFVWELPTGWAGWRPIQSSSDGPCPFGGRSQLINWTTGGCGMLRPGTENRALGLQGVVVNLMHELAWTIYSGDLYDNNCGAIVPRDPCILPPLVAFCSSRDFGPLVRRVDQKINVTNATLVKVPFDLAHWQKVATEKYPNGLPEPESDDPTQWLFHGFPGGKVEAASSRFSDQRQDAASTSALQVAVARLMGYRWPAELDEKMRLSTRARDLVKRCDQLLQFLDADGIVCIPAVRGEDPAAARLLALLAACGISPEQIRELAGGVDLDQWLRESFFEQHCKLFHDRPFVWQIWDGRKRDGFQALVNYHKLCESGGKGRKLLESLTYSYLGEWISRQQDGVKRGEGGAEDRLAAALELQKRLAAILAGEPPYDIFVRWKPLYQQAIGWEPDINDGVRMNIRPFLAVDLPNGKKGAGVLRWKPNIKWDKDRGKEPERKKEEFPWFWGWD
ncbi:MAG: Eco57I restriction-modification methylase domain-containing protein, partial [Phycisphaerae bacterium]